MTALANLSLIAGVKIFPMPRDDGRRRFFYWWVPCAVMFFVAVLVVVVTAIKQTSFRWKSWADPRDEMRLIVHGASVTHAFEMKSDPRDADFPRAVAGQGSWGVPGVFRVLYVPPPKLPPGTRGWVMSMRFVTIQLWPLLVGLGLLTGAGALRIWRLVRLGPDPNVCRSCGYDLRATPGRCPECGVAPSAAR